MILHSQNITVFYIISNGNDTIAWILWHYHSASCFWNRRNSSTCNNDPAGCVREMGEKPVLLDDQTSYILKASFRPSPAGSRSSQFIYLVLHVFILPPKRDFDSDIVQWSSLKSPIGEMLKRPDIEPSFGEVSGFLIEPPSASFLLQLSWYLTQRHKERNTEKTT